ncbi:MAG: hypothetical protein CMK74_16410, partial [Pseudomonadales bacterium]|nr:hypothetical protein [Pseudomonadales bacterium]
LLSVVVLFQNVGVCAPLLKLRVAEALHQGSPGQKAQFILLCAGGLWRRTLVLDFSATVSALKAP